MIKWFNRQIIEYSRPKFLASDDTNVQEEKRLVDDIINITKGLKLHHLQ